MTENLKMFLLRLKFEISSTQAQTLPRGQMRSSITGQNNLPNYIMMYLGNIRYHILDGLLVECMIERQPNVNLSDAVTFGAGHGRCRVHNHAPYLLKHTILALGISLNSPWYPDLQGVGSC